MRLITLALAAASLCSCSGAQSVVLKNTAYAIGFFPYTQTLLSVASIRLEFRLHNFSAATDNYGWIVTLGNINSSGSAAGVRFLYETNGRTVLNYAEPKGNSIQLDLAGRTDILVRLQRDLTNNLMTLEAWNPDGTHYAHIEASLTSSYPLNLSGAAVTFGAPSTSTDLAYMRMYTSLLAESSQPPSLSTGDLGDWEFESALSDKSSYKSDLRGTVIYAPTPVVPINVVLGQFGSQRVWSANHGTLALDGSATYSPIENPAYAYTWSQVSGPATGTFSNTNQATSTFSVSVPGDYLIRLTATDGVTTNQTDVDFGAVNTDVNNIVQTGNPSMDIALGPLSMWGTSPWPWYDFTEMANADSLYNLVTAPPKYGQAPLTGLVSATSGSNTLTGTGTEFLSEITDCNPKSGSGSSYACTAPVSSLIEFTQRDRYMIPDVNSVGLSQLNINGTANLAIYNNGTNTAAALTAGSIYQLNLGGCLTAAGATCSVSAAWSSSTAYQIGATVLDPFFHVQMCSVAGTSGASAPGWNTSAGATTDGSAMWLDKGPAFYLAQTGYPLIYLWWNAPDGPATGRILLNVSSIADDTHLTLLSGVGFVGVTAQSANIQYSHPDAGELGIYWNYIGQPSNNLNYYDVVHALYKLYYRTGLTKYQTEARTFADLWFTYGTGQGYYIGAPRAMGYMGMIDRAIDGHPTIWQAFDAYFNYPAWSQPLFQLTSPQPVGFQFDTRETGYAVRYAVRAAALFANSDNSPNPAKRAAYCTALHNAVTNVLASTQDAAGQWETDLYGINVSAAGAKLNGKFGSSPWRDAMSGLALEEAYPILLNQCGDTTAAVAALLSATAFGNLLHNQGEGAGYGQFGNINYASALYTNVHSYYIATAGQWVLPNTTGTLSVTNGSPVVLGQGTNFLTIFSKIHANTTPAPGVDPAFIGIPALRTNSASCNAVLPVASVQSDLKLTLAQPWPCATTTQIDGGGFGWMAVPPAPTNCALLGSTAQTCEGVPDPSLSHEVHAIWSWLYWQTGDAKYRTWAEQSAGTDYGGPGGGPGTPTTPAGPFATGNTGNFAWALPDCLSAAPPCGGYGPTVSLGKNYAFSAGAGNANNALAYLLLGAPRRREPIRWIQGSTVIKGKTK